MEQKGDLSSHFKLCNYFIAKGEDQRAKAIYESCINNCPLDFRSYFNYAQLCCSQKDYSKALELFYEALKRNETEVIIYSALSGLLILLKKPEEALKASRDGLYLDRTNSPCWYNLNVSLRQLNRMDEAISLSWQEIISHPSIRYNRHQFQASDNRISDSHNRNIVSNTKNGNNQCMNNQIKSSIDNHKRTDNNNIVDEDLKPKYDPSFQMIFICVKYGTKYDTIYVNNLYNALKLRTFDYYTSRSKNSSEDTGVNKDSDNEFNDDCSTSSSNRGYDNESKSGFRFICYTDDPTGLCRGVEVQLLPDSTNKEVKKTDTDNNADDDINDNTSNDNTSNNDVYKTDNYIYDEHESNTLNMKNWKGWWIKAYLFYAVQFLIPRNTNTNKSEHKIEINESSKINDCESILPIWICYLDLDTVLCNNIDFIFDLIQDRYDRGDHDSSVNERVDDIDKSSGDNEKKNANYDKNGTNINNNKRGDNREFSVDDSEEKNSRKENMFYTLHASSFVSEGRPCGINSSIMLWPLHAYSNLDGIADDTQSLNHIDDIDNDSDGVKNNDETQEISNKYINIYYFLLHNYDVITRYIYKFDHYLEMMLLHPPILPPSSSWDRNNSSGDKKSNKNPRVNNIDKENDTTGSPPFPHDDSANNNEFNRVDIEYDDSNNTEANNYCDVNGNKNAQQNTSEASNFISPNSVSYLNVSPILIPPDAIPPIDVSHIIYPHDTPHHDISPYDTFPDDTSPTIPPHTSPSSSSELSNTDSKNFNQFASSPSLHHSINYTNIGNGHGRKFYSTPIKVCYIQDMAKCQDRIVDFANLLIRLNPILNDQTIMKPDALSSELNSDLLNIEQRNIEIILANISIICFPLSPKPHEVGNEFPWIKNLWDGLSI